jgi:hypothetical protein
VTILLMGPIGMLHNEGTILSFTVTVTKVFAILALNLVLVEFSRLYERTKGFGASLNSLLQLLLSWILGVNATVPIWQSKARNFANLVPVPKIALVSIYLREMQ